MKYHIMKMSSIEETALIVAVPFNLFQCPEQLTEYAKHIYDTHPHFREYKIIFAHDTANKPAYKGDDIICGKLKSKGVIPVFLPWISD